MVAHVLGFGLLHRLAAMVNCTMSVMRSISICYPFYRIRKAFFYTAVLIYSVYLTTIVLYYVVSDHLRDEDDNYLNQGSPNAVAPKLVNMSGVLLKNEIPDILGFTKPPISINIVCIVINQCVLGAHVEFLHVLYYNIPFVLFAGVTSVSFVVSFVGMKVQVIV